MRFIDSRRVEKSPSRERKIDDKNEEVFLEVNKNNDNQGDAPPPPVVGEVVVVFPDGSKIKCPGRHGEDLLAAVSLKHEARAIKGTCAAYAKGVLANVGDGEKIVTPEIQAAVDAALKAEAVAKGIANYERRKAESEAKVAPPPAARSLLDVVARARAKQLEAGLAP